MYVIDTYRDPRAVVASLMDSGHEALSTIPAAQKVKKLSESVRTTSLLATAATASCQSAGCLTPCSDLQACQHMTARFKADHRECKGLQTYSLQVGVSCKADLC